jgi:hypothetical protein
VSVEISDSSAGESGDPSSDTSVASQGRRHIYYPRDVVVPREFDINGKQSLKKFLEGFERYFQSKYDGTQRDCSQELARFITGEVKEAYDALGGSHVKYRDIKPSLLQWYKAQSVGKSHRCQAEFKQMVMKEGETYKLYCMRLCEVAYRAFPSDEKECVKQLKKKVMNSTPSWFAKCLEKKEEMKVMLKVGKNITWGEIVEIAERQDKKIKKAALNSDNEDEMRIRLAKLKCHVSDVGITGREVVRSSADTRVYRNSQVNKRMVDNIPICDYCDRRGHTAEYCWRKKGACTICGSMEHLFRECPKYVADFKGRRPSCFRCSGDHLVKDCPLPALNL